MDRSRASSVHTDYPRQVGELTAGILAHLGEFRDSESGVSPSEMTGALSRNDVGDRLNGVVQEIWKDWVGNVGSGNSYSADPGKAGLSPFRQLVVRLIQGRQGRLVPSQQHGLHNVLTRQENPSIWGRDVDAVIGAVNRESFQWP